MKFLVLVNPVPGMNPAQLGPILPAETRHAWEMYKSGVARELYMRSDGHGAVLLLECADAAAAHQAASELPLAKAGLVRLEVIGLSPFTPFESLFAKTQA